MIPPMYGVAAPPRRRAVHGARTLSEARALGARRARTGRTARTCARTCSKRTAHLPAQVTIAGGVGHPHIKKLAYDLCRNVPLLDADCSLILDGIKVCLAAACARASGLARLGGRTHV